MEGELSVSYVATHNPYIGCFQLLLLPNIARACWMYERRSWHKEEWMRASKNRHMQRARFTRGRLSLCQLRVTGYSLCGLLGTHRKYNKTVELHGQVGIAKQIKIKGKVKPYRSES